MGLDAPLLRWMQYKNMNYEQGHDTWMISPDAFKEIEECPRCHRIKPLGTCEDLCRMCQSCYQKLWGMGELPSDSMQQENQAEHKRIFSLVKEIWGKENTKSGFCWVAAKFGNNWSKESERVLNKISFCLESKRDQVICTVHERIHTAKAK